MILRALEADGHDPSSFTFAGQVRADVDAEGLRRAREEAMGLILAGAGHVTLGTPALAGADGMRRMASEVAQAIRDAAGRA